MKGFSSINGERFFNGIRMSDFAGTKKTCKHLVKLSMPCALCQVKTFHVMQSPGERRVLVSQGDKAHKDAWETITVSEAQELAEKEKTHERDLHKHWAWGEAFIGQAAHISSLKPLDRMSLEDTRAGLEQVNRFELAVAETRPRHDRLDGLATLLDKDLSLSLSILEAFRVLELPDAARAKLTREIRADHTKAQAVIDAAQAVSLEVIPPIPCLLADEPMDDDGQELEPCERPFQEPLDTFEQSMFKAIPIGHQEAHGFVGSRHRSPSFKSLFKALKKAKDEHDGKALAALGRKDNPNSIHAGLLTGREAGVLWTFFRTAKGSIQEHNKHKVYLLVQKIIQGSVSGKDIADLTKQGKPIGKVKGLRLTTEEVSLLWSVFKACKPQMPEMPEPPPHTDDDIPF